MATILCVDDSPKTLRLLSSILEWCGYRVLTSRDPDAALRMARLSPFDLAILDYQLPNGNGTSLAKAIKKMKPDVPIMLFSGALPVTTDELDAVDECVSKGESVDDMLYKVRELLQPSYHQGHTHEDQEPRHAAASEPSLIRYAQHRQSSSPWRR